MAVAAAAVAPAEPTPEAFAAAPSGTATEPGDTQAHPALDPTATPMATESTSTALPEHQINHEGAETGGTTTDLPPTLEPSTRPSLAAAPSVDQASHVTEAPSTPAPELSVQTPVATPPAAVARQEENIDPRVATLEAMFPDIDVSILQMILEESGGNTDTAIETLLAMSDPDYQPQPHAQQQTQPHEVDLDVQLAQRLQLEEDQAQWTPQARRHGSNPPPQRYDGLGMQPPIGHDGGQYPYQNMTQNQQNSAGMGAGAGDFTQTVKNFIAGASAKVSGGTGFGRGGGGNNTREYNAAASQNQGAQGQGPDYRQQFLEVAETGRKSISSLLTKAKAKIQELNTPQEGQQGGGQNASYGGAEYAPQRQQSQSQNYRQQQSQSPYYAPASNPTQAAYPAPVQASPNGNDQTGYQINPPRTSTDRQASALNAPSLPTRSSFDTPEGSRASFDTSRMGLKPKRPVSLINGGISQSPPSPTNTKGKNRVEDDEIEYVTSPFEDER
ncbi:hypothetical protein FRB98_008946 [Tulasnella sp. 332]|nr:hypothetical protein FRB98_008946 [Tulasnella sp. 332]